jgi:hypothetical protein
MMGWELPSVLSYSVYRQSPNSNQQAKLKWIVLFRDAPWILQRFFLSRDVIMLRTYNARSHSGGTAGRYWRNM